MLDRDQLTPEETQEQNQPLIRDLCGYYNTRAADNASLERIHARLLQKTTASLPVAWDREIVQPSLSRQSERNRRMKFVRAFTKDRPRSASLATLAAAALLVVLVSSFALLLHLWQGTTAVPGLPPVAHDWSLAAKFSGTGNQTITRQNIEVGQKYGWLIICTNTNALDSSVAVRFNGGNYSGDGSATCAKSKTGPLGPESIITSPGVAMAPIHTIMVTTDASISWELLLFRGTYYPPLGADPDWHALHGEIDGTGNGTWSVDVTLPRTWALQFVCFGRDNIQISLQSGSEFSTSGIAKASAPCNGQTTFDVFDMVGQGAKVSQVHITTGAENDWQVVLAGCANGKPHCGITIMTPTPTP